MQEVGPYRVVRSLGACPVGTVWAAVDAAGGDVTLAVLDPTVASDPRWREAFSATANSLVQSGGMRTPDADFAAAAPWVAVAVGPGPGAAQVFIALGQDYRPTPTPAAPNPPAPANPATPASPAGRPEQAAVLQTQRQPDPPRAGPGNLRLPGPADPWPPDWPPAPPPVESATAASATAPTAFEPMSALPPRSGPSRGRTIVVVAVAALFGMLLGVGGTVIANAMRPAPGATGAIGASPTPSTTTSPPGRTPFATPSPTRPGLEPPMAGAWPATWPLLAAGEKTKTNNLSQRTPTFKMPATWSCARTASTPGFTRHTCGANVGKPDMIGGDVIVRDCLNPCDAGRRAELRRAEEAWGQQWMSADPFTTWAETGQIDNAPRYGLVFVMFWRTAPHERLGRETVFRMTAPIKQAGEIQKVANSLRGAVG